MKLKTTLLLIILSGIILSSCSDLKTKQLEADVKYQLELDVFNENIQGVEIYDVNLTLVEANYYIGEVITIEDGQFYGYDIEVEDLGNEFYYQIADNANQEDLNYDNHGYENNVANTSTIDHRSKENPEPTFNLREHLVNNTFTIEGNGSVSFSFVRASTPNNGTIRVSDGRTILLGNCKIIGNSGIYIDELMAIYGYFDASNNNPTSGSFYLNDEGSLSGTLYGSRESIDITFVPM